MSMLMINRGRGRPPNPAISSRDFPDHIDFPNNVTPRDASNYEAASGARQLERYVAAGVTLPILMPTGREIGPVIETGGEFLSQP